MINGRLYTLNCQLISYINLVTNKLASLCMYLASFPLEFTTKAAGIAVQPVWHI